MLILCITNFSVIQLFLPVQTYLFPFKYGFYIRNRVKSLSKILRLLIWSQCLVYNVVFVNHRKRREYCTVQGKKYMCRKNHENTGQAVSEQTERMTPFCLSDRLEVVLSFFSVFYFCVLYRTKVLVLSCLSSVSAQD